MNTPPPPHIGKFIAELKSEGVSFVESMARVCAEFGVSLDEAKGMVLHSDAWEDRREAMYSFHDLMLEMVRGMDIDEPVEDDAAESGEEPPEEPAEGTGRQAG